MGLTLCTTTTTNTHLCPLAMRDALLEEEDAVALSTLLSEERPHGPRGDPDVYELARARDAVAFRPCRGDRSLGVDRAAEQVGLASGRADAEGLWVSSLRPVLQSQEVTASAHHDRVRQGTEAQMSLLLAPQQVQGQHIETRDAHSSESAVPVAAEPPINSPM
ncbi:PREDICTED: uncharacterized protein LOC106744490 [Dinoponera quadriceps]|uniref:Uncharacterized protein LOC106744490 n=1 Tax=Dinoponera quadriceps TaxID=609295 RepID=A0A6P3X983_DINQU|nr:PREDICTED: uncharacterized protein LOC106744490 [Dinoponera quadriceps]